jgi:hypothetical protein
VYILSNKRERERERERERGREGEAPNLIKDNTKII